MTNSQSDIDELKTLQRKAAELRAERERPRSRTKPDAPQQSETLEKHEEKEPPTEDLTSEDQTQTSPQKATTKPRSKRTRSRSTARSAAGKASGTQEEHAGSKPSSADSVEQDLLHETDKSVRDLAVQIESVVKEMEEAARERPALALLAAFTIGIVVGQIFARR